MTAVFEALRSAELEGVREFFQEGDRILEIGGGTGFQAQRISEWGVRVVSVDVSAVLRRRLRRFPVWRYDGQALPFKAESFDVVFSSNTLEHVKHLDTLLEEMRRVLKPRGTMVHILPTSSWRFWTSLAHYLYVGRILTGLTPRMAATGEQVTLRSRARGKTIARALKSVLLAPAHGEYPSALAELYFFSRSRWRRVFEHHGLSVAGVRSTGLYYTGYLSFPGVSLRTRARLSAVLGSAGRVFLLRTR